MNLKEYYMGEINKTLDRLDCYENCPIENRTKGDLILFNTPFSQKFPLGIQIQFNGIRGEEGFIINTPSLNIKGDDLIIFSNTINNVITYVKELNRNLSVYKICIDENIQR